MNTENLPPVSSFKHRHPVEVRFNDVDILGHVNNTVYFSIYDTGKAIYFRDIADWDIDWREVETVIANIDCAYMAPMFFGEDLEVCTKVISMHDKSFRLLQMIWNRETGQVKSACETVMVSFDPETQHAIPMPSRWRRILERELGEG